MKTPIEQYDELLKTLSYDSSNPNWSPALRELHVHSRDKRLQVIPDFFYTSVFSPKDLPADAWSATFPHSGVFDRQAQIDYLANTTSRVDELSAYSYAPATETTRYHWGNDQFSHADAAVYYMIVRQLRPKSIVEIGSGHSTKLAVDALKANGSGRMTCIEPYPPAWLGHLGNNVEVMPVRAQTLDPKWFQTLEKGDILFIDSSHIAKTGSDVNHIFLRILPTLRPGVMVHVHDICLPYEYQRYWSEDVLCYWNEQYVLGALLSDHRRYKVKLGVYFLQHVAQLNLRAVLPPIDGVMPGGGSIWFEIAE